MSLKAIAERTGVSISTVSRALNGTARISDGVRSRVFAAAREIGYLEGRSVQGAIRSISVAVPSALLSPSDVNFVSWTIFEGLRTVAAERGIRLNPVVSDGDRLDPGAVLPVLATESSDAVIVFFDENPAVLSAVAATGKPCVLLAGQDPTMQIPSVGIGNRYGARLGTEYLLGLGHRNISLLTWRGRYTIRQREDGYREAMEQAGEVPRTLVLTGFAPETAEAEIAALIAGGALDDATALFCLADNIALAAMRAMGRAGRSVPGDVSVLGFDDVVAGEMTRPALTTIHAPLRDIGPAALEELDIQHRNSAARRPVRRVELGCSLVTRASCRPLR